MGLFSLIAMLMAILFLFSRLDRSRPAGWGIAAALFGAHSERGELVLSDGSKRLMAARDAVYAEMQRIVKAAEGRNMTQSEIEAYEMAEKLFDGFQAQLDTVYVDPIVNGGGGGGGISSRAAGNQWLNTSEGKDFASFVRTGIPSAEMRALSAGSGSAGGYLVPTGFRRTVTERKKAFDAVRRVATHVETDAGNDLPWPSNDDTANVGGILAENTQATETDVVLGTKLLDAYKFSSDIVRFSIELLQDSDIDLVAFLERKLAERIGRKQSTMFTTGTGTSQPLGIVTGATSGVTAAGTAAITSDELLDLIFSVDPAYREPTPGHFVGFMMSDTALKTVRKLKASGTGEYIFQADASQGFAGRLHGYPVAVNNDMAVPATGVKSVLFGDLTEGYVVRDVKQGFMTVFKERYADYGQQGVLVLERADGTVQDSYAYRALTQA